MKSDVIIIGSSAAGLVAATTGKQAYPEKELLVITRQEKTLIPCGIPYVFGSVYSTEKDILPAEASFQKCEVNTLHEEVIAINREKKSVTTISGKEIFYEKLVLATGSNPIRPKWLKGAELQNVFTVPKNKEYLDEMQSSLSDLKKVLVIGAGFIGIEVSDELNKLGKDVTLIEKLPHILSLAFDEDISERAEIVLKERGVKIRTGIEVKEIIGNNKVEGIILENGEKIDADAVVLSLGYFPNNELAKEAGLEMNEMGFIKVDEYMRTADPYIFAIGDCAEKKNFITRKSTPTMLASTACAEARIAGMNLFKLSAIKTFSGTISIFSTAIGNNGFGVAGITEKMAKEEGFCIVTGVFEGIDRHPGSLADTSKQFVKLIVAKDSGVILGGEVAGGLSIGELTNVIGLIIQNRMTINSLIIVQIGTHPLLTASPAAYPLIKAAENAYYQM